MKSVHGITFSLLLFLSSCYPYKKVSTDNFRVYGIPKGELEYLHFIIKEKDLHYVAEASRNNYNIYNRQDASLTDSYSTLTENNLLIPKGASGKCVDASEDQIQIDFGEGVVILFRIHGQDNSPANQISVDQQSFDIVVHKRTASLYFDASNYSKSGK